MAISFTNSSIEIESSTDTTARLKVTILDDASLPVTDVQVRILATPADASDDFTYLDYDNTATLVEAAENIGYTDTVGELFVDFITTVSGPRTFCALVGEDDGKINGHERPRLDDVVCPTGQDTTIAGGTFSSPQTYTNTYFQGGVTLIGTGFQFNNCTFDAEGTDFAVSAQENNFFDGCQFINANRFLFSGKGGQFTRCLFKDALGPGARLLQDPSDQTQLNRYIDCIFVNLAGHGIFAEPVQNLTVTRCWFDLPHEDSPAFNGANSGEGAIIITTSSDCANIDINTNWLYGGINTVQYSDGGGQLTNSQLISNRFGAKSQFNGNSSKLVASDFLMDMRGNVDDDSGQLLLTGTSIAQDWPNQTDEATFFAPSSKLPPVDDDDDDDDDDGGDNTSGGGTGATFDTGDRWDFDDPFTNNGSLAADLTLAGREITIVCNQDHSGAITELTWNGTQVVNSKYKNRGIQNAFEIEQNWASFANLLEAGAEAEGFADPSSSKYIGDKQNTRQLLTNTFLAYAEPITYQAATLISSGNILARDIYMDYLGNPHIVQLRHRLDQYASTKQGHLLWSLSLSLSELFDKIYTFDTSVATTGILRLSSGGSDNLFTNYPGGVLAVNNDESVAVGLWRANSEPEFTLSSLCSVAAAQELTDPKFTETMTQIIDTARLNNGRGSSDYFHHQYRYLCVGTKAEVEAAFLQLHTELVTNADANNDLAGITVSSQPTVVDVDEVFSITVTAVDNLGQTVSTYNGPVTISDLSDDTDLGGTKTINFTNGVATYSDLVYDTNGIRNIKFTSGAVGGNTNITVQNLIPVLDSISPTQIEDDDTGVLITLDGSEFTESSQVYLDSTPLDTVIYITDTQLQALIPGPVTAGLHTVRVLNTSPGGGFTQTVDLTVIDVTAPLISNIQVSNITADTADVSWDTNEPTTGIVTWTGPTGSSVASGTLSLSHTVTLTGLLDGLYTFDIDAADAANNMSSNDGNTFTVGDSDAPVITQVRVVNISDTQAEVQWTTDEPADSEILWTSDSVNFDSTSDSDMVTSHSLWANGLTADTFYDVTINTTDASGNLATTTTSFTTDSAGGPPPDFVNQPAVTAFTDTTIDLGWRLTVPAQTYVSIGTSSGSYNRTENAGINEFTIFTIDGLTASTEYFIVVHSHADINVTQDFLSNEVIQTTDAAPPAGDTFVSYEPTGIATVPLVQTCIPIDPSSTLPTFYVDGTEADVFPVSWTGGDLIDVVQVVGPGNNSGNATIASSGTGVKPGPSYNTLDLSTVELEIDVAGKAANMQAVLLDSELETLRTGSYVDERVYFSRIIHTGHPVGTKDYSCGGVHTFVTRRADFAAIELFIVVGNDVFDTSVDTGADADLHTEVAGNVWFKSLEITNLPVGHRLYSAYDDPSMDTVNNWAVQVYLDPTGPNDKDEEQMIPARGRLIRHYVLSTADAAGQAEADYLFGLGGYGTPLSGSNTFYNKPGWGAPRDYHPEITNSYGFNSLVGQAAVNEKLNQTRLAVEGSAQASTENEEYEWWRRWGFTTSGLIGDTPLKMTQGYYQPYGHPEAGDVASGLLHPRQGWQNSLRLYQMNITQMVYQAQRQATSLTDIDGSIVTATKVADGNASTTDVNNRKSPWSLSLTDLHPQRSWPHFVYSTTIPAENDRILAPNDRVWNGPDSSSNRIYVDPTTPSQLGGLRAVEQYASAGDSRFYFGPYTGESLYRWLQTLQPLVWGCNLGVAKWLLWQEGANIENTLSRYPVLNDTHSAAYPAGAGNGPDTDAALAYNLPRIAQAITDESALQWGRPKGNLKLNLDRNWGAALNVISETMRTLDLTKTWRGELKQWSNRFIAVYDIFAANTGVCAGQDSIDTTLDSALAVQDYGNHNLSALQGAIGSGWDSFQLNKLAGFSRGALAFIDAFYTRTDANIDPLTRSLVVLPYYLWNHADGVGETIGQNFVVASNTVNGPNDPPASTIQGWDFTLGAVSANNNTGGTPAVAKANAIDCLYTGFVLNENAKFRDWIYRALSEVFVTGSGLPGLSTVDISNLTVPTNIAEAIDVFNFVAGKEGTSGTGHETSRIWANFVGPIIGALPHIPITNTNAPPIPDGPY